MMDEILLVLTNLPDRDSARRIAHSLIENHAAACVNILAECSSVYRWQGKTENAEEVPLLIKTTAARYAALEAAIRARHPDCTSKRTAPRCQTVQPTTAGNGST